MNDRTHTFWSSQADTHGRSHSASWGDNWAIDLEIETIGRYIKEGDRVLDVGCANGYSTLQHLDKGVAAITGVDFSEAMIREAHKNLEASGTDADVSFKTGDVRNLPFEDNQFDTVYTTRTIINLPSWDEQKQGLGECLRVCKPGGTVVFSEGFWEPLMLLNAMRSLVGLEPLVEHDFNRYIKKSRLETFLRDAGHEFEVIDFSSVYYLGSRFLRDLVTDIEDYPGYSNPINEIFYNIEKEYSGGGFGIQQAFIVRK